MPRTIQTAIGRPYPKVTETDALSSVPPADLLVASAPDVFGPSHPLYELVSSHTQLPDVLTRLVLHYTSHLYPRQASYNGNVLLTYTTGVQYSTTHDSSSSLSLAFVPPSSSSVSSSSSSAAPASSHVSSTTATATAFSSSASTTDSSAAAPFSFHKRSWSMSGWMSRAVPGRHQLLLSVSAIERATAADSVIYFGHPGSLRGVHTNRFRVANCFGVAFHAFHEGNSLSVQPPLADINSHHEWEHWCTTLHYPRPDDCGPYISPTTQWTEHEEDEDEIPPVKKQQTCPDLARRRLYRNGVLVAEDDCQPPHIDHSFTLVLGGDEHYGVSSLHGGLCDVRVYSRALEAAEVQALYQGDEEASSSGEALEMWYKLDATGFTGGVAQDSSGHGRHAVVGSGELLQLSMTGGCNVALTKNSAPRHNTRCW